MIHTTDREHKSPNHIHFESYPFIIQISVFARFTMYFVVRRHEFVYEAHKHLCAFARAQAEREREREPLILEMAFATVLSHALQCIDTLNSTTTTCYNTTQIRVNSRMLNDASCMARTSSYQPAKIDASCNQYI